MQLDSIRSFIHVAETGSFSLAAQRLKVMQSTISGRIQALEEELGCVLFRRGRSGAELTPAGRDFRAHAEQIVQSWDRARHHVALPEGFTSIFRFGGPVALQDELNVTWVLWMKENAPSVALQLEAGYSDVLIEALASRMMDAAVMYLPRQRPGLIVEELLWEDLVLVRHPEFSGPWQKNFVAVNWGHEFAADFIQTFPEMPPPSLSVGLGALGLQYLLALKGAAFLPLSLTRPLLADGRLRRVEGVQAFKRPVYLVFPAQPNDPDLLSLALGGLRTVVAQLEARKHDGIPRCGIVKHDIIIRGGTIIDGSGAAGFTGDLGVDGDRITAVGDLSGHRSEVVIDAAGRIVAPGFIDAHTHDDGALLGVEGMAPKISQGVTTVVAGNCGISLAPLVLAEAPPAPFTLVGGQENFRFDRFADYVSELERAGTATNAALLVGHTTLRRRIMPALDRAASPDEIALMQAEVEKAMAAGAFGLSTGLDYAPAVTSSTEEVKALARVAAAAGGLYVTHTRNYFEKMEEAIDEAIEIAVDAETKLVISHHQVSGRDNFGKAAATLERIDAARERLEIALDCYPYAASSTVLKLERCDQGVRIVITWSDPHPEMANRDLSDIAREWNCTERAAAERLLPAGAVYFQLNEADVRCILSYSRTMIGSDGLPHDKHPHPRLWGTFPRVLGHYAREVGLFSLEEAVFRMTGLPAGEFGITQRGRIIAGNFADIVLFDAEAIGDTATFEHPKRPSAGIDLVLVNGEAVWRDGKASGLRPGRVLKPSPSARNRTAHHRCAYN